MRFRSTLGADLTGLARDELGHYQPRARHSSRWGRSEPKVVSLPWPGYTQVSSANRLKTFDSKSSISELKSFGVVVRPGPPGKRLSPVKMCGVPSGSSYSKAIEPGVCPTR